MNDKIAEARRFVADNWRHYWHAPTSVKGTEVCGLLTELSDEVDRLSTQNAKLLEALEDILPLVGWSNYNQEELEEEARLGNGAAPLILKARAAIAKLKNS